ncbi:MAG: CzcE family metal-binding protein, partial [Betaproteobacteria bacterium]|nr:CzcE family metal-binding protein [Betaproteobacteria bacterium]
TIKLSKATGSIYVDHFATARFENDVGESFVWRFDSAMEMSNFPLKIIAPRGFDAGNTWVIVLHPSGHFI